MRQAARRRLGRLAVAGLVWVAWVACVAPQASAEPIAEPLNVFVSVAPERYLARRVGGDLVEVAVMVQPGHSPATYEPTPRQMQRLARAELYFAVSVPFERAWLPRIRRRHPNLRIVDLSSGVSSEQGSADLDPHIWTSPSNALRMAELMRDAFQTAAPGHASAFEAGFSALAAEVADLDGDIRRRLATASGRRFLVVHPAWGHFAREYGLEQIALERHGKSPGARRLARIIDWARQQAIDTILTQEQFSAGSAEVVARAIDAELVAVDPLAEDYLANMRRVARIIAEAAR